MHFKFYSIKKNSTIQLFLNKTLWVSTISFRSSVNINIKFQYKIFRKHLKNAETVVFCISLFVITEPMKFKAIQILTLLRVISLNFLDNILGQSFGIQLRFGNEWDSEYPEHKLVQHLSKIHIRSFLQKEGWQSKKTKGESRGGGWTASKF